MLDYMYYRFYRLWRCSSLSEAAVIMAIASLGIFLSINILTFWALLFDFGIITISPFSFEFDVFYNSFLVLIFLFFVIKKRYKKIKSKYEDESNLHRKRGNLFLSIYIIFTFAFALIVAFTRK